eukprot:3234788-Amphidinium_carterae.3
MSHVQATATTHGWDSSHPLHGPTTQLHALLQTITPPQTVPAALQTVTLPQTVPAAASAPALASAAIASASTGAAVMTPQAVLTEPPPGLAQTGQGHSTDAPTRVPPSQRLPPQGLDAAGEAPLMNTPSTTAPVAPVSVLQWLAAAAANAQNPVPPLPVPQHTVPPNAGAEDVTPHQVQMSVAQLLGMSGLKEGQMFQREGMPLPPLPSTPTMSSDEDDVMA